MAKVQDLLSSRCKQPAKKSSKMAALAEQTARGERSGFAGLFSVTELSASDREALEGILDRYSTGEQNLKADLTSLVSITSEVQAINNQAALLHGERIKRGQTILKKYADGAFTAWLIETYGNRQTPYNLLQYYEFYTAVPPSLRERIEIMPRQAIYTLASREGDFEKKCQIVEQYDGETKTELLALIRETFPLDEADGRRTNGGDAALSVLRKASNLFKGAKPAMTSHQRDKLLSLLDELRSQIQNSKTRS